MTITEFEQAVLDSFSHDFENAQTVAAQLSQKGNASVSTFRVREAFLSLAAKAVVQAHVVDSASNEYVPISAALASAREDAWFSDRKLHDHRHRR